MRCDCEAHGCEDKVLTGTFGVDGHLPAGCTRPAEYRVTILGHNLNICHACYIMNTVDLATNEYQILSILPTRRRSNG